MHNAYNTYCKAGDVVVSKTQLSPADAPRAGSMQLQLIACQASITACLLQHALVSLSTGRLQEYCISSLSSHKQPSAETRLPLSCKLLQADIQMHSYQNGTSERCKRDNWEQLQRVANKNELQLPPKIVEGTVQGQPGAAVALLELLYEKFTGKK